VTAGHAALGPLDEPARRDALPRAFYARPAEAVAADLLGQVVVHVTPHGAYRARVVETEAYVGPHDRACHASKGRTTRTEVMFGPPGHAYVYLIYGMYDMFNIVTSAEGDPQAVLIRAGELRAPDGSVIDLRGPGRFARGLHITRTRNKADLCASPLYVVGGPAPTRVGRGPRINVGYSGSPWRDLPLRFVDLDSRALSTRGGVTPVPLAKTGP
jgi:DNA-3-methyladenine glycosylase